MTRPLPRRRGRRKAPFAWRTAATVLIAGLIVAWFLTQGSKVLLPPESSEVEEHK
jgi:hypothetical protein